MLVSELRELLKKYKEEDLRLLISEMYKAMPKKLREDKDIDALMENPHVFLRIEKVERAQDRQADVKSLIPIIKQFIDYAYKQYYFAPNNYVHKKDRPKWRFLVKTYIKRLQAVSIEGEDGRTATNLLEKLYQMLCYASGYYIFNTDDPFRSVGIEQTELFDIVIQRKLGCGMNPDSIKSAIDLVINNQVDRVTSPSSLINILVENLKSPDAKEITIEQCMILKTELAKSNTKKTGKMRVSDSFDFVREEKINNLVEMVFRLNIALCEYEKAIIYYVKNNIKQNSEISLYALLRLLFEYELKEYWVREYGEAVKKGVKPRDVLQKTYHYIQENDSLPEYYIH